MILTSSPQSFENNSLHTISSFTLNSIFEYGKYDLLISLYHQANLFRLEDLDVHYRRKTVIGSFLCRMTRCDLHIEAKWEDESFVNKILSLMKYEKPALSELHEIDWNIHFFFRFKRMYHGVNKILNILQLSARLSPANFFEKLDLYEKFFIKIRCKGHNECRVNKIIERCKDVARGRFFLQLDHTLCQNDVYYEYLFDFNISHIVLEYIQGSES